MTYRYVPFTVVDTISELSWALQRCETEENGYPGADLMIKILTFCRSPKSKDEFHNLTKHIGMLTTAEFEEEEGSLEDTVSANAKRALDALAEIQSEQHALLADGLRKKNCQSFPRGVLASPNNGSKEVSDVTAPPSQKFDCCHGCVLL